MKISRYLIASASVLNVVLLAVLIALAVGITVFVGRTRHDYPMPRVKEKAAVKAQAQAEPPARLPSDYALIGEMNLFHPDRVIPVDRKAEVPRPEFVLYGTTIEDSVRLAFIEDKKNPRSTPGRGNRQSVVRKGEVVSGYTVTEIATDRIEFVRGDDRITVLLSPPGKRKETASPAAPRQGTAQVKPVQAAPPAPPGGARTPALPVGQTAPPNGVRPAAPPARTQPSSAPRSTPE